MQRCNTGDAEVFCVDRYASALPSHALHLSTHERVENVDKMFITSVDKGVDFNHLLMYSSARNNRAPCSRSGQAMKLGGLESIALSPVLLPDNP